MSLIATGGPSTVAAGGTSYTEFGEEENNLQRVIVASRLSAAFCSSIPGHSSSIADLSTSTAKPGVSKPH